MYRVSFTGHRPDKLPYFGEDDPAFLNMRSRLAEAIDCLIRDGADEFYTGMARGVDMWAAELVLEQKERNPAIRLIAVKPCPNQCKGWTNSEKQRYDEILAQCDKVMTISPAYDEKCMHKRDRALVDLCDVLVAVYSGSVRGGTAYTVSYANQKARKLVIVPPV